MNKVISRKELFSLVWEFPMTKLAKRFEISDVGLRKICLKLNIPLPKGGHWQKIRAGKKIQAPALPSPDSNEQVTLEEVHREVAKKQYPWSKLQEEIEADTSLPLKVPSRLTNPSKMILQTKQVLIDRQTKDWRYNATVRDSINIAVQPKNFNRALLFMDTFIKLLSARGHTVEMGPYLTYAVIFGERIKIQLRELTRIEINPNGRWGPEREFIPTGALAFKTDNYCYSEWKDGSKRKLEEQLGNILAKMETAVIELHQIWEVNRKREEEAKRIKREREEYEQQKKLEFEKFKHLLNKSLRWKQVAVLRDFIDDAEARAMQSGDITIEFKDWLVWARKKADWYDPYLEASDDLLDNQFRTDL